MKTILKDTDQNVKDPESAPQLRLDESAVCDVCGRSGAFHFGDRTVCQDCYAGCGSCCPEFGKDDLWTDSSSS